MAINLTVSATPAGGSGAGMVALLHTGAEPLFAADSLPAGLPELLLRFHKEPQDEILTLLPTRDQWAICLSDRQVKYLSPLDSLKVLAARVVAAARKTKSNKVALHLHQASSDQVSAIITGLLEASYEFTRYKSKPASKVELSIQLLVTREGVASTKKLLSECLVVNNAVALARDLVNETPIVVYPDALAQTAREIAQTSGLTVHVFDEKRLQKERCNGVLTVGRGSSKPPRLMILSYKPRSKPTAHLVLVGKAVTFDTGGYSIKPAKSMWEMKGDMAGGAAVLAAMQAIGKLKPSCAVTAIVPSAVNAVGPDAVMPGEIITSRSGKTVHVDNTDAEGRLLLMDALNIACGLKPTHIVDIATLTGSIVRAIGHAMSGLFTRHDELSELIQQSGEAAGELYWRMPMIEEYRSELSHPVADIDNVGRGNNAGSITAALFLSEFVDPSIPWAHLDIAGCGLMTRKWKHLGPGATGVGVKTFIELAKRL